MKKKLCFSVLSILLLMCLAMFCACQSEASCEWFPQAAEGKVVASWQLTVKDHAVIKGTLSTQDSTEYVYRSSTGEITETAAAKSSSSDSALLAEQLPALASSVDSFLKENDSSGKCGYILSLMPPRYAFGTDYMQTLSSGKLAVYSLSKEKITILDSDEYTGSKSYGVASPAMTDDPEFGNSDVVYEWTIFIDD